MSIEKSHSVKNKELIDFIWIIELMIDSLDKCDILISKELYK